MDSCNFLDENHFHLLFDDYTPPYVDNIVGGSEELVMTTNFHLFYYPVVAFITTPHPTFFHYRDDFVDINGSICLDPNGHNRHLENYS